MDKFPYSKTMPNGVVIESCVPFLEDKWWDNPVLHFAYSYTSWAALILRSYGLDFPTRWHKKVFAR